MGWDAGDDGLVWTGAGEGGRGLGCGREEVEY